MTTNISVKCAGKEWRLNRRGNLDELWEDLAVKSSRIPYWVELWPASLALGNWLYMRKAEIRGRKCLDLGCGLGLTAIIGQSFGAEVAGADYEPEALAYCVLNARLNNVGQPAWILMDWAKPALLKKSIDFIWAADIFYEKVFWEPVLRLFAHSLADNGKVWIAEPGRPVFKSFLQTAMSSNWHARPVYRENINAAQNNTETLIITVWELTHKFNPCKPDFMKT